MANTFLQFVMRRLKWEVVKKILGMIPEKVRKIVGWILLIFGAVVMLWFWIGSFLYGLTDEMSIITSIVGIFSIVLGLVFLTNKVWMVSGSR